MERRDRKPGEGLRVGMDGHVLPAFLGRILPYPGSDRDALIAASALVHGVTVVTRDVRHFEPRGVVVLNPWES